MWGASSALCELEGISATLLAVNLQKGRGTSDCNDRQSSGMEGVREGFVKTRTPKSYTHHIPVLHRVWDRSSYSRCGYPGQANSSNFVMTGTV